MSTSSNPVAEAVVRVRSDGTEFQKDTNQMFKKVAGAAAAAFAAVKIKGFLTDSIAEARESQKVFAQTGNVLKTMGTAAGVTATHVDKLSLSISNQTGIDDELIAKGENLLLTFGHIQNKVGDGNDIFDRATRTMVDMGAALGGDASSNALKLGRALNDPIAGMSALSRVGVQFSEDQKAAIKRMVETGDTLGAQKLILDELDKKFEGSASAQATAGEKMSTAWNNFKESVGTKMLPAVDAVENAITSKAIPAAEALFNFLTGPVASNVGRGFVIMADAAGKVIKPITDVASVIASKLTPALDGVKGKGAAMGELFPPAFVDFVSNHKDDIIAVAAALSTLAVAGGVAVPAVAVVGSKAASALGPIVSMAGGVASLAAALPTAALAATGIGLAVIAAGAAIYLAYQKIEPFRNAVDAAGRTLRDVFGVAVAWLADVAIPAARAALTGLVGAFSALPGLIAGAVTGAISAVRDFATSFDFLNEHVYPLVAAIIGLFVAMAERIIAIFTGLISTVQTVITDIIAVVQPLFEILGGLFSIGLDVLKGAWDVFWTALSLVVQIAINVIEPAWQAFATFLTAVIGPAFDLIKAIVGSAMDIIRGIIQVITAIISGDWSKAWDGIKSILQGAWDAIVAIITFGIEAGKAVIAAALVFITTSWTAMWDTMKRVLQAAWDVIKTVVSTAIDVVVRLFTEMPGKIISGIGDFAGAMYKLAFDVMTRFFSGITEGAVGMLNWFAVLPGVILGKIGDIAQKFYNLGKDIMQKLIDGIQSMFGALLGKIGDVLSELNPLNHIPGGGVIKKIVPGLAAGGIKPASTWRWVGEDGPELMGPSQYTERVINHSDSVALMGSRGGSSVEASLVIQGNIYGDSHLRDVLDMHLENVQDSQRVGFLQGRRAA